jgi:hypothetical protein
MLARHIRQKNCVSRDYNRRSGKCIKDCLTGQECHIAGLGRSVKNCFSDDMKRTGRVSIIVKKSANLHVQQTFSAAEIY